MTSSSPHGPPSGHPVLRALAPGVRRLKNAKARLQQAGRERLLAVRDRLGLAIPGVPAAGEAVVLMYHGVVSGPPSLFNWRHVSAAQFDIHLDWLRRRCHVVSLAALYAGERHPGRLTVALTFDDGFRNNLTVALPLLRRHGLPASFFITAAAEAGIRALWPDFLDIAGRYATGPVCLDGRSFIKQGRTYVCAETGVPLATVIRHERPDWPFKESLYRAFARWTPNLERPDFKPFWELMSDDDIIRAAACPGVTIGCHGYYHNNLGNLPPESAREELLRSKAYLEQLVQYDIRELAFPDGSYTPDLVGTASALGFTRQLAVDHRFHEPPDTLTPARRHGVYSMAPARSQLVDALRS